MQENGDEFASLRENGAFGADVEQCVSKGIRAAQGEYQLKLCRELGQVGKLKVGWASGMF